MSETIITIRDNGPYRITGPFTLVDAEGNAFEIATETTALCRCGMSRKKPFCDATHKTCGFADTPRATGESSASSR